MRKSWAILATIIVLQPVFLLALIATDFIAPAERRAAHLTAQPPLRGEPAVECVALGIGLEPGASPLRNAITAARPSGKVQSRTPCDALHQAVAAADADPDIVWLPYDRYWHGYRVVLDPLTALLPWRQAQFAVLALLIACGVYFVRAAAALLGWPAAVVLTLPMIVMTDLPSIWTTMQAALATGFILGGSGWMADRIRTGGDLLLPAAVTGAVFNYLDFMINPPWQPMLIAFFVIAGGAGFRQMAAVLTSWAAGYAMTWAAKWGIAVLYGGDWSYIWDTILYRIDGSYEQVVDHRPLAPSLKAIRQLLAHASGWWILLAALIAWLVNVAPAPRRDRWIMLSLPALIPFAWFELLSNHTQIHVWFAYRPIAASFGIVLAAWPLSAAPSRNTALDAGQARQ
jgi:hypothetical protein